MTAINDHRTVNISTGWDKMNCITFDVQKYARYWIRSKCILFVFSEKIGFLFGEKGFFYKKNEFRSLSENRAVENERHYLFSALCNVQLFKTLME